MESFAFDPKVVADWRRADRRHGPGAFTPNWAKPRGSIGVSRGLLVAKCVEDVEIHMRPKELNLRERKGSTDSRLQAAK